MTRRCTVCRLDLPIENFAPRPARGVHGRESACRPCRRDQRQTNRMRVKKETLKAYVVQASVATRLEPNTNLRWTTSERTAQRAAKPRRSSTSGPRCARCSAFGSYQQILPRWTKRRFFLCRDCLIVYRDKNLIVKMFPISGQAAVELAA